MYCFFSGTAFSLRIYLTHSLFLDIHLVPHFFTFLTCDAAESKSIFKKELLSICSLAFSQSVCFPTIMNLFFLSCKCITLSEFLLSTTFFLQCFNAFFSSSDNFDGILFILVSWKKPFLTKDINISISFELLFGGIHNNFCESGKFPSDVSLHVSQRFYARQFWSI